MNVYLKEIDKDNFIQAIKLTVKEDQKNFVASNAISIAQSKFHTFLECYGIFSDDEMVGFSAIGKNPEDGTIWIVRHMIGADYQGKGLGKAGLKVVIKHLQEKFNCNEIFLDVEQNNIIATNLYKKAGFITTGESHGDSPVYKLDLELYDENY
ncbi:MAG: GNAT family N-acetyltransferase [Asgard group archaeon]|nr:GNAT family N-acetyltransferase [Asgard group archaeon]